MKSIFSTIKLSKNNGTINAVLLSWILSSQHLLAQDAAAAAPVAANNNDTFFWIVTISVIAVLALIIGVLVRVINIIVENERTGTDLKRFFSMLLPIALLLGSTQSIFAQDAAPAPDFVYANAYYLMALMVIILEAVIIILLANFVYKLLIAFKHIKAPKPTSWFNWNSLNAAIPIEREAEVMTDHNYDGIRELDNQLPPWWVYGFYGTILFAVLYLVNYHVIGYSPLQGKEYATELELADQAKREMLKNNAVSIDENSVTLLTDATSLAKGKGIFKANCAACHGQLGEGLVGPNFTDDYWIHGGGIVNVFKIAKYGVAAKGMAPWETQMSPQDLQAVCSYIVSLKGTNPPNAKAPQGNLYKPDAAAITSTAAKTDTSTTAKVAKDSTAVAK